MSDADRKRRLRSRQRNCEIVVPCVVNLADIKWLLDHEWLKVAESEDRKEIACAIMQALRSARDSGTRGHTPGREHGL